MYKKKFNKLIIKYNQKILLVLIIKFKFMTQTNSKIFKKII